MFYIKRMFWLCLMLFVSLSELSAQGPVARGTQVGVARQRTHFVAPKDAELSKYPVIRDTTGARAKLLEMGLRLDTLEVGWVGLNHVREVGRFAYDSLHAGTLVYVDSAGTLRYKADCFNRLAELSMTASVLQGTGTTQIDSMPSWMAEILKDGINVNVVFPPEFYKALGERQVVLMPSSVSQGSGRRQSFISRHKWWFIGGGAILLGYGIYECTDGDGCYLMINRQIIRR